LGPAKENFYALESLKGYIVSGCWGPKRKFRFKEYMMLAWNKPSPFELRATNVRGVSTFIPPSQRLDRRTVNTPTLIKHGILVRRPNEIKEPVLFELWRKVVEEIWTEEHFSLPVLAPQLGITHALRDLRSTDGGYTSTNWSGCVLTGSWAGVMGVWRIPMVSQPSTPESDHGGWTSSSWVGLDGTGGFLPNTSTTDVLQAGVAQTVDTFGNANYVAWYEWYVENLEAANVPYVYQTDITSFPVNPGDEVSVIVQYVKHKGDNIANPLPPPAPYSFGAVSFVNVSTNQAVNLYLDPPTGASFLGDSAEWIMELNDDGTGTLPLFGSIKFESAGPCDAQNAPYDLTTGDLIHLRDAFGRTETTASAGEASVTIKYNDTLDFRPPSPRK
jgi:hypothetical protein